MNTQSKVVEPLNYKEVLEMYGIKDGNFEELSEEDKIELEKHNKENPEDNITLEDVEVTKKLMENKSYRKFYKKMEKAEKHLRLTQPSMEQQERLRLALQIAIHNL